MNIVIQVLPFECKYYPGVIKYNNDRNIIIVQGNNYCTFNIYHTYVHSSVEKIIWIGFYKNGSNDKCLFKKLPKDLIIHILKFAGKQLMLHPYITTIK